MSGGHNPHAETLERFIEQHQCSIEACPDKARAALAALVAENERQIEVCRLSQEEEVRLGALWAKWRDLAVAERSRADRAEKQVMAMRGVAARADRLEAALAEIQAALVANGDAAQDAGHRARMDRAALGRIGFALAAAGSATPPAPARTEELRDARVPEGAGRPAAPGEGPHPATVPAPGGSLAPPRATPHAELMQPDWKYQRLLSAARWYADERHWHNFRVQDDRGDVARNALGAIDAISARASIEEDTPNG